MAMAIGLFCFHKHLDLCRSRIQLLRQLNPDMRLFGLYGGPPEERSSALDLKASGLEAVHESPGEWSAAWSWQNTDLAVLNWYRVAGRSLDFGRLHVVQWDLLFFCSLARAYSAIGDDVVALTGLTPLKAIAPGWHWTTEPAAALHSNRLLVEARSRFGFQSEPFACLGPGYSLPRRFLDAYADLDVPDLGHDELRLPLFATVLGFELADTGFYPRWGDSAIERTFNANGDEIDPGIVALELASDSGRRVFHPCRGRFDDAAIRDLLSVVRDADNRA
jgi:hypothetical protein